jgi:hypothetical protein
LGFSGVRRACDGPAFCRPCLLPSRLFARSKRYVTLPPAGEPQRHQPARTHSRTTPHPETPSRDAATPLGSRATPGDRQSTRGRAMRSAGPCRVNARCQRTATSFDSVVAQSLRWRDHPGALTLCDGADLTCRGMAAPNCATNPIARPTPISPAPTANMAPLNASQGSAVDHSRRPIISANSNDTHDLRLTPGTARVATGRNYRKNPRVMATRAGRPRETDCDPSTDFNLCAVSANTRLRQLVTPIDKKA